MPVHYSLSRRDLLRGKATAQPFRARPPGVDQTSLQACTRCGACVDACPENILQIVPEGVAMLADAGECTFCHACADACPEDVFADESRMAHVMEVTGDCFVQAGIACMTCRDACPEEAITMKPRIGAPFEPRLDAASCTGCAACSSACPAEAIRPVERETEDA